MMKELKKINDLIKQVEAQINGGVGVSFSSMAEGRRLEHYLEKLKKKKQELEGDID